MNQYQNNISDIIKKSTIKEVAKNVWNQWIIRVLGLYQNGQQELLYHPIPQLDRVKQDRKETIKHMQSKLKNSIDKVQDPETTYTQIEDYVQQFQQKYSEFKQQLLLNEEFLEQLSDCIWVQDLFEDDYDLDLDSINNDKSDEYSVPCLQQNYQHIQQLYEKNNSPKHLKDFYIFELIFNYYFIDGVSLQLAVPPPCMNILQKELKVQTEVFASPLNHYFENYHSLFYIDTFFCSKGNSLSKQYFGEGGIEVNPPFIESYMLHASKQVIENLEFYEQQNKYFFCFYTLPWEDCEAYKLLAENEKYFIEAIKLDRRQHYYYQINDQTYQSVPFNSYIVFLGTTLGKKQFNQQIKERIIQTFQMKQNKFKQ